MRDFVQRVIANDRKILYLLNHKIKCPMLDRWMPKVTHLGGATFTVSLFILLLFIINSKRFVLEGLISLTVSHLLVQVIKRSFTRPRPYMVDENINIFHNPLKDYSFPSGHTTAIFSLTTTISLALPWLACLLYVLAVIVGLSRIYLGLHYPVDVGIGAIIGFIFAVAVHLF
jgi:undecaprenyl-diphosphatase